MTVCSVCKRTFEQHVGHENDHPNLCHSWTPATKPRTHEKIARNAAERLFGVGASRACVDVILAAIREAADAARQEERETLSVLGHAVADGIARSALGMHTSGCQCSLHELLRAVGVPADARSRADRWIDAARQEEREALRKLYLFGDEEIHEGVYVEWRGRRYGKGPVLWAVTWRCYCLNKSGEWEYEPQPSSHDDAFIARCRWTNLDEAIAAARSRAEDLRGSRG